jgi:hypothetical protein
MQTLVSEIVKVNGANKDNFYKSSKTVFTSCARPESAPDYVSDSGSEYWYSEDGVIRFADHWGYVASCEWYLDDFNILWTEGTGYASWESFERKELVWNVEEVSRIYKNGNCKTKSGKLVSYRAA